MSTDKETKPYLVTFMASAHGLEKRLHHSVLAYGISDAINEALEAENHCGGAKNLLQVEGRATEPDFSFSYFDFEVEELTDTDFETLRRLHI